MQLLTHSVNLFLSLMWVTELKFENFTSGQSQLHEATLIVGKFSLHMLTQNLLPLTLLHLVWFFITQNLITPMLAIHRGLDMSQALC